MNALLKQLYKIRVISALDYQFAKFLGFNDASYLILALLSHANGLGHSFISKKDLCTSQYWFNQTPSHVKYQPIYTAIMDKLRVDPADVDILSKLSTLFEEILHQIQMYQSDNFPVIYDRKYEALYLANNYHYECEIAKFIRDNSQGLSKKTMLLRDNENPVNDAKIANILESLFDTNNINNTVATEPDWQKFAAGLALTQKIAVISGGPGTGKTTTVAKVLAGLIILSEGPLRIALCAPTGKAAARLSESIQRASENTLKHHPAISPAEYDMIPKTAMTIHRLLGLKPYSNQLTFHMKNPLPVDVLLVDEASMVDLAMMYQLISALPSHAKLILLGDKDQLASVESGSVLAQLSHYQSYSPEYLQRMSDVMHFDLSRVCATSTVFAADYFSLLRKSYRFDDNSAIGCLARAVKVGDLQTCYSVFDQTRDHGDHSLSLMLIAPDTATLLENEHASSTGMSRQIEHTQLLHIKELILNLYQAYFLALKDSDNLLPEEILAVFSQARVLCATRLDLWGVESLNTIISQYCKKKTDRRESEWFHGRPIMITENAYSLALYNGDVGICLLENGVMNVYFETTDGIRKISPMRLPRHETAWVMTVHKSQGSEFDNVLLILPFKPNYVMSRELLYTGVTRAKRSLSIMSSKQTFEYSVITQTRRFSYIAERIMQR